MHPGKTVKFDQAVQNEIKRSLEFVEFKQLLHETMKRANVSSPQRLAMRIVGSNSSNEYKSARSNIHNWLNGHVPYPKTEELLSKVRRELKIDKSEALRFAWEFLIRKARARRKPVKNTDQIPTPEPFLEQIPPPIITQNTNPLVVYQGKKPNDIISNCHESDIENFIIVLSEVDFAEIESSLYKLKYKNKISLYYVTLSICIILLSYAAYIKFTRDPGPDCDMLAAAPWDTKKPISIRGIDFGVIEVDRARAACSEAVRVHPQNARYYFQLGRVSDRQERYKTAASFYYRAIELDKSYSAAHLNLGILFEHGQTSAETMGEQLNNTNKTEAAMYYKNAAEYGLPTGRYCYAISLTFGWKNQPNVNLAREQLVLAKRKLTSLRNQNGYTDAEIEKKIDSFLIDVDSPDQRTGHVSCDPRHGVTKENEIRKFP